MAVCYNCNKKIGFFESSRKAFGKKICFPCIDNLGYNNCLSTNESLYPEKHFKNFEQLLQILKERKLLYDQMDKMFKQTCEFKDLDLDLGGQLDLKIDENSKIICIVKRSAKIYFNYSDFIKIEELDNRWKNVPGQVLFFHYFIYYNLFGSENILIINKNAKNTEEAAQFFKNLKSA